MKKIASVILSTVIVASVIAGCNSQPATSESSVVASVAASDPAAATDDPAAGVQDEDIPQSLDELYGPQLSNYLNHQYYFEGEPIPITESTIGLWSRIKRRDVFWERRKTAESCWR